MTLTPVLSVEAGGRVVRGLALPFNQPALVLEDDGSVVAEVMDDQSVDALPGTVPLLVGHNRAAPAVGVVRTFGVLPGKGVGVEAELAVNDQDLDTWRRRFATGLSTGLSIGFRYDKRRTRWQRPVRHGDPPTKRPRGVQIEEVSLVQWPAYTLASVTAMAQRSAADQRRHDESQEIIKAWEREQITRAHKQRDASEGFGGVMHPAYGWRSGHRQRRARLLPLAYGQPCPLCGDTMLPTQELHLDHSNPLDKDRGLPGDRIVHGNCNRRGLARLTPPDNTMTVREW